MHNLLCHFRNNKMSEVEQSGLSVTDQGEIDPQPFPGPVTNR